MRTRRISAVVCALATAFATAAAAATDFTGTWVLNTSKGENLGMVAAIQETLTIVQSAEQLSVKHASTFQGRTTERQVNYDLTGKAVMNEAAMGERSETVSRWEGDALITTWTSEGAVAGTQVVKTETRALGEGGKVMSVATARADRPPMVLVYERQE